MNTVLSCNQVIQNPGPNMWGTYPSGDATFGTQMVSPNDTVWTQSFGEGVAACNDYSSNNGYMWENSYLFQCVEIANRFINEEWGLTEFTVNAAQYYDYYLNGTFHNGQARDIFGNQVQLSDDINQGNNFFAPSPRDLLVFQEVNNSTNWTSGLKPKDANSTMPGHVVVIASVASDHVNVVQENWHNGETWSFPLTKVNGGYHITDNSGVAGRITRGWIHFSANAHGGNSNGKGVAAAQGQDGHLEAISHGNDNNIWHAGQTASNSTSWNSSSPIISGYSFNGDPAVGIFQDALQIFTRGSKQQYLAYRTEWSQWLMA